MEKMTVTKTGELTVYTPIAQQLAEIKAGNAALVFDYEDPDGNKQAVDAMMAGKVPHITVAI